MAVEMSNEQIIEEFDSLFATDDDDNQGSEGNEPEGNVEPDGEGSDGEGEGNEPEGDEGPDGEGNEPEGNEPEGNDDKGSAADKKRRQQNYAFAEMRNKLKAKDTFIEDLAASIGLDSNLSTDEKQAKIKEAILQKQAKESGIPLETLQRLEVLEARDRQYQLTQRQQQTQDAMAGLVEKYSLDNEDVESFVQQLIEDGKNPLEVDGVDLETEYLKLNFQTIVQREIDSAVQAERDRSKKATSKAASAADTGHNDGASDKKINSVKDLDDLFNGMDL